MINVKDIEDAVELCLWSGYIKGENPVSLLLVANPESGKTRLIEKYKNCKGIEYMTDLTAYGLAQKIIPKLASGQKVKHVLIPDLLNPLSKQKTTSEGFIMFLNTLTEEGVDNLATYSFSNLTQQILMLKQQGISVQCGVIGCITKEMFNTKKQFWRDNGFLSRMMPLTFSYSLSSINEILNYIVEDKFDKHERVSSIFPQEEIEVEGNIDCNKELLPVTMYLSGLFKSYGFRAQIRLQTLLKASALRDGRKKVEMKDVENVKRITNYINFEYKKI